MQGVHGNVWIGISTGHFWILRGCDAYFRHARMDKLHTDRSQTAPNRADQNEVNEVVKEHNMEGDPKLQLSVPTNILFMK
jgi:hypothetical protein